MLLFLDIDGVMIPAKGWKSPELLYDGFPAFSEKATRALQSIITEDTILMLTTSHKSRFTIDEWKQIFKSRDINISNIRSLDGCGTNVSRRDEIVKWFNINSVEKNFVILDDDKSLNELPEYLKKHLVLISPLIGLNEGHVQDIKRIKDKTFDPASF